MAVAPLAMTTLDRAEPKFCAALLDGTVIVHNEQCRAVRARTNLVGGVRVSAPTPPATRCGRTSGGSCSTRPAIRSA